MTFPADPSQRQPKGDHDRRLSLGMDRDVFAAKAGISAEQLRRYEETPPDGEFDLAIAERIGVALEQLEASPPPTQKVIN
jgi:hypothetical protein